MFEYSSVTELPGHKITKDQLKRMYHRYRFAQIYCEHKKVLEAACGGGMGLGYLKRVAHSVIGGDIDNQILKIPETYYKDREGIEIQYFDAQALPYADDSFDVVLLYEAVYYLPDFNTFINESIRALSTNGTLIICTSNKEWSDFNPSPYSVRYYSASELYDILRNKFSSVEIYGAFPTEPGNIKEYFVSFIKKAAVKMNLMPKTMKGKKLFKRIFMGKLVEMPYEITEGIFEYEEPKLLPDDKPINNFKVLYAVAKH